MAIMFSGFGLLPEARSVSLALLQLQSVLLSMAPITTESSDEKAAQSCPCPSFTAELGKTSSVPHQLNFLVRGLGTFLSRRVEVLTGCRCASLGARKQEK